jgi:hypothetical protein
MRPNMAVTWGETVGDGHTAMIVASMTGLDVSGCCLMGGLLKKMMMLCLGMGMIRVSLRMISLMGMMTLRIRS